MKRLYILLAAAALLFVSSCNEQDKVLAELLDSRLKYLEQSTTAQVPDQMEPLSPEVKEYAFHFDKPRYGVDAGGSVTVGMGIPKGSTVEVSVPDGWNATVSGNQLTVTAPDPASPGDIVVTATNEDGQQTAALVPVMVRDQYSDATRPEYMTMGYYGFKARMATLANYRKLAEAGIKIITVETDEEGYMNQLDLAEVVGMKCIPVVWYYAERYALYGEEYKGLDDIINLLKDHPATYAYHIYDEPSTKQIPTLKYQKDKIESLDPVHPVYINLNPDGSPNALGVNYYHEYIEAFARDCQLKFISFDMYPLRPETDPDYPDGIVGYWYQCMETVSSVAKKYGIPFWAFAASCWIDNEQHLFEKPTVENLRMQVYTNLAYGAQVVEYFTILQYGGTTYAPVLLDGTWTGAYDTLKEFNTELHKRGYIFTGCTMDRVRYTHLLPTFCMALSKQDLPPQIADLTTSRNAIVSFIENNGNQYVVVCNRTWKDKNTLNLVLNDMVYVIDREGEYMECMPGETSFTIDEGDMLVIKVK